MAGHRITRFVFVDSTCRLEINEDGWLDAGRASTDDNVSNVVSLLGRTHHGKSFICREILRRAHQRICNDGPNVADDPEDMHPTSSDVVSFLASFPK